MKRYFTKTEIALWSVSTAAIVASFFLFDRGNYMTLAASIIGVTSLIFNAKGNPFGQLLMVIFSIMYGIISFRFRYYGEIITYLGMTAPMAVFALVSWLRNPFKGNKAEVAVNRLHRREVCGMLILTTAVTALFYFILGNSSPTISATIKLPSPEKRYPLEGLHEHLQMIKNGAALRHHFLYQVGLF